MATSLASHGGPAHACARRVAPVQAQRAGCRFLLQPAERDSTLARMNIARLFSNAAYAGKAKGDRRDYHVFQTDGDYLVVSPNTRGGYIVNPVRRRIPDAIAARYRGRKVTSKKLRQARGFGDRFHGLNALYVLVALGRARKLAERDGRSLVFKIR